MYVDVKNEARNRRIQNGKLNRKGHWDKDDWSKKRQDAQADRIAILDTIHDGIHGTDPEIKFHENYLETPAENVEWTVDNNVEIAIGEDGHIAAASFDDGTQDLLEIADILGIDLTEKFVEPRSGSLPLEASDPNDQRQKQLQSRKPLYV